MTDISHWGIQETQTKEIQNRRSHCCTTVQGDRGNDYVHIEYQNHKSSEWMKVRADMVVEY